MFNWSLDPDANPCACFADAGRCRSTQRQAAEQMQGYTKSESKVLRELAGKMYEWELHNHLEPLAAAFDAWRRGELLSSELSDRIHEFHQHPAREVWSMHQWLKADQIVARGVALGAISRDALSAELLEKLAPLMPKLA